MIVALVHTACESKLMIVALENGPKLPKIDGPMKESFLIPSTKRGWNIIPDSEFRNPTDIVGLRNLYDRAETQIRSLESLGVKGESYSNLLTPILLKQIPSELVLEFNRSQKDEG
ncbi:uncharacterized protein TNCV_2278181, partial [Trichonephila clavipes]